MLISIVLQLISIGDGASHGPTLQGAIGGLSTRVWSCLVMSVYFRSITMLGANDLLIINLEQPHAAYIEV